MSCTGIHSSRPITARIKSLPARAYRKNKNSKSLYMSGRLKPPKFQRLGSMQQSSSSRAPDRAGQGSLLNHARPTVGLYYGSTGTQS